MTALTLRRVTFAVLAVAVGITGIAIGLARDGTPTPAADSHPAVPPVGQLQYQRVDAPASTIARTPSGEVVATMTDGARTVALLGPERTFADPDYTAATVTTTTWIRLMPQEWTSGSERQPWFQPWLEDTLGDTSPDMFAVALQYLRGQPADTDRAGVTYRGDAGFGPEATDAGARQENSDFYDYLGVPWTFANGKQEIPDPAALPRRRLLRLPAARPRLPHGLPAAQHQRPRPGAAAARVRHRRHRPRHRGHPRPRRHRP